MNLQRIDDGPAAGEIREYLCRELFRRVADYFLPGCRDCFGDIGKVQYANQCCVKAIDDFRRRTRR